MRFHHVFTILFILFFVECSVHGFESGEHALLGDIAFKELNSENSFERLEDEKSFSYGYLIALSGDYYKSIEESALDNACFLFKLYFNNNQKKIKGCIAREIKGIKDKDLPYDRCGQIKIAKRKLRYATLASDNFSHFGWNNLKEYVRYHKKALWFAKLSFWKDTDDEWRIEEEVNNSCYKKRLPWKNRYLPFLFRRQKFTKDYLINMSKDEMQRLAVYANAYADHFLTDAFSAGHLRVPRSQIDKYVHSPESSEYFMGKSEKYKREKGNAVSGALTQYIHNVDGHITGTQVTNSNGDRFISRSDKQLFAKQNSDQMAGNPEKQINCFFPIRAVNKSISELFVVIEHGPAKEPQGVYEALKLVPFVDFESSGQKTLSQVIDDHVTDNGSSKEAIRAISHSLQILFKIAKGVNFDEYFEDFTSIDNINKLMIQFQNDVLKDLNSSEETQKCFQCKKEPNKKGCIILKDLELKKRIPEKLIKAYIEVN